MTEENNKEIYHNILPILLTLIIIGLGYLIYSIDSNNNSLILENQNLKNEISELQEEINSQPPSLNITESKLEELKQKENILLEIKEYQKKSVSLSEQSNEAVTNLIDYSDSWYNSEVGSQSEERALNRYEEELEKLQEYVNKSNELILSNSDLIQNHLFTNPSELISSNNLLFTTYEDDYFFMLNYEE